MKVNQIYELVNETLKEVIGDSVVLEQDLTNLVDAGEAVVNSNAVDNYVKSLVNRIGRVKYVNRVYKGNAPSVLKDAWEFGSILQKIDAEVPDATVNESWNLEAGRDYSPYTFVPVTATSKFFNSKNTFEIEVSIYEHQVKESFASAEQMAGFLALINTKIDNKLTIATDGLVRSTIGAAIGEALLAGNQSQAVNLAQSFYNETGRTVTLDEAVTDPEFIKHTALTLKKFKSRLSSASKLFNRGATTKFTYDENLNVVILEDFKASADVYLQSNVFHNTLTALPSAEAIPFWQGSGLNYDLESVSKINVVTPESKESVEQTGIIATMFDKEALGVHNFDRRVKSIYNPSNETYKNYYKQDAGYFIDGNENFVVFYIGDVVE